MVKVTVALEIYIKNIHIGGLTRIEELSEVYFEANDIGDSDK
jgi:hypothetical protein